MKQPNFFIIGSPKCGTTALAQYLGEHPQIFMSTPKEPHYFNTDLNYGSYRERSAYLRLFSGVTKNHVAVGEASVWYLYSHDAVPNILREIPEAKFIVMLRNPTDMAPALHEQLLFSGYETEPNFEIAWELQEKRMQGQDVPRWCPDKRLLLYRNACLIGEQMQRLFVNVGKDNVLVLLLDELQNEPRSVWVRVQEFLGVEDDSRIDFPIVNSAKERRLMFVKRLNDVYASMRERYSLPPMRTGIFDWLNERNVRIRGRAPISDCMKNKLVVSFDEDICLLERVLGVELRNWRG